MKNDPDQLPLFPKRALFKDAPGKPFSLQASPEEIVICAVCGRERLIRRREGGSGRDHASGGARRLSGGVMKQLGLLRPALPYPLAHFHAGLVSSTSSGSHRMRP